MDLSIQMRDKESKVKSKDIYKKALQKEISEMRAKLDLSHNESKLTGLENGLKEKENYLAYIKKEV